MPDIVWKRGAENDLLQIFADLEERREGAGEEFVTRLDLTLANMRDHPELAPMYQPPVRRLVIATAGLGLFYSVEPRGIVIHALIHLSRSPASIREKIRGMLPPG